MSIPETITFTVPSAEQGDHAMMVFLNAFLDSLNREASARGIDMVELHLNLAVAALAGLNLNGQQDCTLHVASMILTGEIDKHANPAGFTVPANSAA